MMRDGVRLREEGFGTDVEPRCVAVYALLNRGMVVYIGASKNVWSRIGQHFRTRKRKRGSGSTVMGYRWGDVKVFEFDELLLKYCYIEDLERLELDCIARYRPEHNIRVRAPYSPIRLDIGYVAAMIELGKKPKGEWRMSRRKL